MSPGPVPDLVLYATHSLTPHDVGAYPRCTEEVEAQRGSAPFSGSHSAVVERPGTEPGGVLLVSTASCRKDRLVLTRKAVVAEPGLGDFKKADVDFSQFLSLEGQDQGAGVWRDLRLVQRRCLLAVSSRGGRGEGALWGFSYKDTNPFVGAPPS